MVDKAELRIGNFVRGIVVSDKYLIVTEITNNGVHSLDGSFLDFETIEPIALTDEILIKSGFIYGRKYCFDDFYDFKKVEKDNDEEVWLFIRNNENLRYIKYVHQAQNLFYNLSGEELQIIL